MQCKPRSETRLRLGASGAIGKAMSGGTSGSARFAATLGLRVATRRAALAIASPLAIAVASAPALAQTEITEETSRDTAPGEQLANAMAGEVIDFEAQQLSYDSQSDIVIARGNVLLRSGDRSVRANEVSWDRKAGSIIASGNVRLVDEGGNQLFTDQIELNDQFEAGAMADLLIALRAGGRLAARSAARSEDGTTILTDAAYTACAVTNAEGCAKNPSWRITAQKVIYDQNAARVRFRGAMVELFGARILPLPGLALRTDGNAESGFLVPDFRITAVNGLEISGEYYWRLSDNRDLKMGAYVFSNVAPMGSAQWRHLTDKGAYQITGFATASDRASDLTGGVGFENDPRGYLDANGRFQFSPEWSLTGSVRVASDRTFLRRYDLSREDRLRSVVNLERIDERSYLLIAGWATQTLRIVADQGQIPIALPAIDYRHLLTDPIAGGRIQLQANTLALVRTDGQDTQRAFAGARWDLKRMTGLGQVVTLTGLVRGDVYNTQDTLSTITQVYRGREGWTARGIATAALDIEWPFVGEAFGGTQVLKPRVQFVASPNIRNLDIPNEDARAIDLEDSNLFALNRFGGYDRIEDGARVTWGLDWELTRPGLRIKSTIGQSYRLEDQNNIFPVGTGLSERVSDFVGRTEVRFSNLVSLTHRYRLDKDSFIVRRNELDAAIGSARTYIELGYLRLNRNITTVEDLVDREELRAAGRIAFARHWSVFGSGIFSLSSAEDNPFFTLEGFEPIRTRIGVAYSDECLEFGATFRRDFVTAGDALRGNTFQLFFALRNLGFR